MPKLKCDRCNYVWPDDLPHGAGGTPPIVAMGDGSKGHEFDITMCEPCADAVQERAQATVQGVIDRHMGPRVPEQGNSQGGGRNKTLGEVLETLTPEEREWLEAEGERSLAEHDRHERERVRSYRREIPWEPERG